MTPSIFLGVSGRRHDAERGGARYSHRQRTRNHRSPVGMAKPSRGIRQGEDHVANRAPLASLITITAALFLTPTPQRPRPALLSDLSTSFVSR